MAAAIEPAWQDSDLIGRARGITSLFESHPLSLNHFTDAFAERAPPIGEDADLDVDLNNPRIVEDDRKSHKEYFARLKFKYLELMTKETFLEKVLSDVPPCIEGEDNTRLEEENALSKASLKEARSKFADGRDQIADLIKEVARENSLLQQELQEMQALLKEVEDAEDEIVTLQASIPPGKNRMTTALAEEILESQVAELQMLSAREDELSPQLKDSKALLLKLHRSIASQEPGRREAELKLERAEKQEDSTDVEAVNVWLDNALTRYKELMSIDEFSEDGNAIRIRFSSVTGPARLDVRFDPQSNSIQSAEAEGNEEMSDLCEASYNKPALSGVRSLITGVIARCQGL